MNQQEHYDLIIATSVAVTCSQLTDIELNSIYLSVLLDTDPTEVQGYDKVKSLFTENKGTRMHRATEEAFAVVWRSRCVKKP